MLDLAGVVPDRALQNTSHTATVTLYVDGVATDATGSVTYAVTNVVGTAVASGTATDEPGTGIYSVALTPAHTASLDTLTIAWTATIGGQAQIVRTVVEVVGGYLFTLNEARQHKPLDNTTTYTAASIARARVVAEQALEEACERAFVPRYTRETINGHGLTRVELAHRNVRSARTVSVDGTALTATELESVLVDGSRYLYTPGAWGSGVRNLVVGYEHGLDYPPPRVSRACLLLAKRFLVDSPIHDRATSVTTDDGTTQFFVTAGVRDAVFDVPEANAVVEEYGLRAGVF